MDFLDVIFFAAIAGAFIWLYIHDRKLEKPEVNVTVNMPETKVVNNPNIGTDTTTGNLGTTKKTTEIPMELPNKEDDWLNITPTDSN